VRESLPQHVGSTGHAGARASTKECTIARGWERRWEEEEVGSRGLGGGGVGSDRLLPARAVAIVLVVV